MKPHLHVIAGRPVVDESAAPADDLLKALARFLALALGALVMLALVACAAIVLLSLERVAS